MRQNVYQQNTLAEALPPHLSLSMAPKSAGKQQAGQLNAGDKQNTPPFDLSRRHAHLMAIILLVAFVVRLISLGDHSAWYDESFSILFARNDMGTMLAGTVDAVEHPLLYYATLSGWMGLVGQSVLMVRLYSVFTGLLTIALVYQVTRHLFRFNARAGLAAALIMTFAPFHVQYSQETRMYSLMALLLMVATLIMVRWWCGDKRNWTIAAFGLACGLAMHTQQLAAFYLVALGLTAFLMRRRDVIVRTIIGAVLALAIFAPWLLTLPAQISQFNAQYWITSPDIAQGLLTWRVFLGGGLEVDLTQSMLLFGGAIFVLALLLFQIWVYSRKPRRKATSDRDAALFALWLVMVPVALMWLVSQVVPLYLDRALIASAVMLYVLLGWLFTRSELPRPIALFIGLILLMMTGIGLLAQWRLNTFPYSPVNAAMAYIQQHTGDSNAVVIHMNKLSALPGVVHAPDLTHRFIADIEGSPEDTLAPSTQATLGVLEDACIQAAARGADTVWFVVYERAAQQYAATNIITLSQSFLWLETYFDLSNEQSFNDLIVYDYRNGQAERPITCPTEPEISD